MTGTTKNAFQTERVEREDLVMFINACFACTGQAEFYGPAGGQEVAIEFLHEYILVNYRKLYARTLAAGINHFNQRLIIVNLLRTGKDVPAADRAEEGALIGAALRSLPPQRAFKALCVLREERINNRRARAVIRDYLASRSDPVFDAVKYRLHVRSLATHAHLSLPGEMGSFLFQRRRREAFVTPLFETVRQARHSKRAIFDLPMTVAAGYAAKKGISQAEFLERIAPRMTQGEKLRFQQAAEKHDDVDLTIDLGRAPLTRLALYILSLSDEERTARRDELHAVLERSALRALQKTPMKLGRVAAVLDRSFSASGSGEKRRRPLAVALGASYLLRAAAREYHGFWTQPSEDETMVTPKGQTNLAMPLVDALAWSPDVVVIISDGYENDPTGAASEVARCYRHAFDREKKVSIVHLNPVFDSERFAPRGLGPAIATVGLRDAEDLLTMLGFARFAEGSAALAELEKYLATRVSQLLGRDARRRNQRLVRPNESDEEP